MKKSKTIGIFFILLTVNLMFIPFYHASGKNAISYNKDGWEHLKRSDNFKAIFSFKNALKQNPKYKEALTGLGRAYYNIEEYDRAIDLFNDVLKINKNSSEAYVGLGLAFTGKGNFRTALNFFNKAVKISEESIDAKYGIAYLYYTMGKKLWAKRKLENILRINPYHYDSLLLMADMKSSAGRLDEAEKYIEKAIDSQRENPRGFIKSGEIFFQDYLNNENDDSLAEAKEALRNALSIQPGNYHANRLMGNIFYFTRNFKDSAQYYKKALSEIKNSNILYNLAISSDRADQVDPAMRYFLQAFKINPSDSVLKNRFEDFLVFRDYKTGHPARIMLNREYYELALNRAKRNYPDEAMMYLRRSLLLNPMDYRTRELLMDYYSVLDYDRFYIDELKELLRMYPGRKYRDRLTGAILKRRKMLYHREGYSVDEPLRDVPRVLVMNFHSKNRVTAHPDAGEVIASSMAFVMKQYGRMNPVGIRTRAIVSEWLKCCGDYLVHSLDVISAKVKSGEIKSVDYVIYGNYYESGDLLSIEASIMDFHKGVVIGEFNLSESGKESLSKLSLRAAKRIYNLIPFKGRVLRLKEDGIVVNLGIFDGIEPGEKLEIYKYQSPLNSDRIKERVIFSVKDANTLISFAVPQDAAKLNDVYSNDIVYPLKRRRARKIE